MQPCGLAAFRPIQLGLMGTFRYTFAVIVCICFCFFVFFVFVFSLFVFCFFACVLLFALPVYYCSDVVKKKNN